MCHVHACNYTKYTCTEVHNVHVHVHFMVNSTVSSRCKCTCTIHNCTMYHVGI